MSVTPAKPTTTPLSGGKVGLTGTTLYIKAQSVRSNLSTRLANVTGDGDSDPMFVANGFLYGQVSIRGWMIQGQSSGSAAALKAGASVSVVVTQSASRTLTGTLLISAVDMNWQAEAQMVPMAIAGTFTGTITEA